MNLEPDNYQFISKAIGMIFIYNNVIMIYICSENATKLLSVPINTLLPINHLDNSTTLHKAKRCFEETLKQISKNGT